MSAGQQGPNEREEPFCTKNILVCHSLSHLFNETYGPEKEPDIHRAVDAPEMGPGVHSGRPGEMSGSYGDSDMFNLPQLFEIEAEADTHQGESGPEMKPSFHRPGEMSGSWYGDPDMLNLPQLF